MCFVIIHPATENYQGEVEIRDAYKGAEIYQGKTKQ